MNKDVATLREVVQKLVPMLASKGLRVTQQGARAFVQHDPRTNKIVRVNIPHIPDTADHKFILAIQGFIDHEVGHVLFTDFMIAAQTERRAIAIARKRGVSPKSILDKLHQLHNLVEDPFVERKMGEKFPGAIWNIDRLHDMFLERITMPAYEAVKGKPADEFSVLVVPLVRAWAGQRIFDRFLAEKGFYESQPLIKALNHVTPAELKARVGKIKDTAESLDVAEALFHIIFPETSPMESSESGDGASGDSDENSESSEGKSKSKSKSKNKNKDKDKGEGEGKSSEKSDGESSKDKGKPEKSDKSEEKEKPDDADKAKDDAGETDGGGKSDEGNKEEVEDEAADDAGDADEEGSGEANGVGEDKDDTSDDDVGDEPGESDAGEADAADDGSEAGASDDADGAAEEEEEADAAEDSAEESAGEDEEDDAEASGASAEDDDGDEGGCGFGESDADGSGKAEKGEKGDTLGVGPSAFADLDPDLSGCDLAEAVAGMITDDATSELEHSAYRVYTREWDKIEPLPIDDKEYNPAWLAKLEDETRHMVGPMQKDIERMMAARSQVLQVPGFRSGRLHGGSLHRLMVNDDRVFRRRHDAPSKETAVTLLVDNSGSMSGSKMKTAAAVSYALSQTLERVGIAHEVIGFTTHYDIPKEMVKDHSEEVARTGIHYTRVEPIYMPVYKGWDEHLTSETRKRFARMFGKLNYLSQNIDGECIRIAAERLLRRREQRKVLIVLSDGAPACGSDLPGEITRDCRRAVEEVTRARIETIGIGILTDAVRRFYPKHIVLNDLAELPKTVMGELKRILLA